MRAFEEEWRRWQGARLGEVTGPEGDAALAATVWLDDPAGLAGLPGHWSWSEREVRVALEPADGARVEGQPASGELAALAPGSIAGPVIRLPALSVQVIRRRDRFGVRVFKHARGARVSSIEAYAPDAAWVLPAAFTPLPADASLAYAFELDDTTRALPTPGVVALALAGRSYELRPFLDGDELLLVFADETTGRTTKPPSRFLLIRPPSPRGGTAGPVSLDFNRAFLPPCAFSDQYNCPLPPPAHRLAIEVSAGERRVVWLDAGDPMAWAGPNGAARSADGAAG